MPAGLLLCIANDVRKTTFFINPWVPIFAAMDSSAATDVDVERSVTPQNGSSTTIGTERETGEPLAGMPGDPELPPIYSIHSTWNKRFIVLLAAISAFFSPVTAQIYLPALNVIAEEFQVSAAQINLTVTTYMIFQGITPMFIGGFADTAGRRPAYVICFVVYIAANIGLALSKRYASLLVTRCLQSAGSSTTVALCQAVVADIVTSAERGQYVAITAIPTILGPSVGPVLGGVLSEYLGWRWIFWFLAIAAAINLAVVLFWLPETCRRIVGDGSSRAHPIYSTFYHLLKGACSRRRRPENQRTDSSRSRTPTLRIRAPNPLSSLRLLAHKELFMLLVYSAVVFAGFYAIVTALPSQLAALYGFNDLQIGLMYLSTAGGSLISAAVVGPALNANYRRHATRLGMQVDKARQADLANFPIERARLEVGLPLLVLSTAVTAAWGWAIEGEAHVAAICVLLFLNGLTIVGFNNSFNVLIVDICPGEAGAAVAANNLTRCLVGAAATALIVPMIEKMGAGGAFSLIAGLYLLFSPMLFVVMGRGMRWRAELKEKEDRKLKEKRNASADPQ
ncbi:major facilitator superfamily domain-containing protein [Podospora aff. communis PSN243]|uniref:Major facilitator superfamily domain-containing protein n=1 Tax=Podospora aff. communis PSN243 TaxID=3040156 RepID=A0AAV9G5R7_9PEZI|nr:major facilitator superfamily domain-containing protein [Podospora aff. communis PSN243]